MKKKSEGKALFLDRDGVINVDSGYTYKWSEKIIIKESIELVKRFNAKGFFGFYYYKSIWYWKGLLYNQ